MQNTFNIWRSSLITHASPCWWQSSHNRETGQQVVCFQWDFFLNGNNMSDLQGSRGLDYSLFQKDTKHWTVGCWWLSGYRSLPPSSRMRVQSLRLMLEKETDRTDVVAQIVLWLPYQQSKHTIHSAKNHYIKVKREAERLYFLKFFVK